MVFIVIIFCLLFFFMYVVGVHNTEYFVDDPSICAPDSPKSNNQTSESKSLLKTSIRKIDTEPSRNSNPEIGRRSSSAGPRNGRLQVSRIVGPDAYYMGIVDFQQLYNFEKKVLFFFYFDSNNIIMIMIIILLGGEIF